MPLWVSENSLKKVSNDNNSNYKNNTCWCVTMLPKIVHIRSSTADKQHFFLINSYQVPTNGAWPIWSSFLSNLFVPRSEKWLHHFSFQVALLRWLVCRDTRMPKLNEKIPNTSIHPTNSTWLANEDFAMPRGKNAVIKITIRCGCTQRQIQAVAILLKRLYQK